MEPAFSFVWAANIWIRKKILCKYRIQEKSDFERESQRATHLITAFYLTLLANSCYVFPFDSQNYESLNDTWLDFYGFFFWPFSVVFNVYLLAELDSLRICYQLILLSPDGSFLLCPEISWVNDKHKFIIMSNKFYIESCSKADCDWMNQFKNLSQATFAV